MAPTVQIIFLGHIQYYIIILCTVVTVSILYLNEGGGNREDGEGQGGAGRAPPPNPVFMKSGNKEKKTKNEKINLSQYPN